MKTKDNALLAEIQELKTEHPAWGYRRVWAYLKKNKDIRVNHKRVHRIMKINNLLVPKNGNLKARRTSTTNKPRTEVPHRIWGTDMTKIMIHKCGWAYLHVVLDWGSKKIVGHTLSLDSKTCRWTEAVDQGILQQFPNGYKDSCHDLMLVSDNGCQPTSKAFKSAMKDRSIEQIFTSYCNPKGNADTERVIRTIKEDLIWINEWQSFEQLKDALQIWVKKYNEEFPHMSLRYMTPVEYERNFDFYYCA